jgi:hypothetical protein
VATESAGEGSRKSVLPSSVLRFGLQPQITKESTNGLAQLDFTVAQELLAIGQFGDDIVYVLG